MYEIHEKEQYFFTEGTLEELTAFLEAFDRVCCLCAPLLGRRLADKGRNVRVLDIDERFRDVPGFRLFDIHRPEWLGEEYDVIVCDPPFFNVSLSRLFVAVRTLARNDFGQPLMISYLERRRHNLTGTFARFELRETGYFPTYQTVKKCERNDIQFFSNLPGEQIDRLKG